MLLTWNIFLKYHQGSNLFYGRMSSADSQDSDSSVLLNGHFDSPLGSPGAGDCGSCVGQYIKFLLISE